MVKGFIKTLEAVIAATMIMVSLFILVSPAPTTESLANVGDYCLQKLEDRNLLASFAANSDETGLRNELANCISPALDFQVEICDTADCSAQVPEKSVFASSYISSGFTSYSPKLINLWMWYR